MTIPEAFQSALQHHQAGRLPQAEAIYRQILAVSPRQADAWHLLGVIAHQAGRGEEAVELIRRALELHPGNADAYSNLGAAYRTLGRLEEAIAAQGRALELNPHHPDAHNNLGLALTEHGQLRPAVAALERALQLRPDFPIAWYNFGNALSELHRLDEAVAAYRRAWQLQPGYLEACNNLGNALRDNGCLDEALAAYRRALEIQPDSAVAQSNLIYALHFHPGDEGQMAAAERQRWNRLVTGQASPFVVPHPHDRRPERRLRIGYVSSDFRDHVVGRNLVPLFEQHDPQAVEIFCYSGVVRPDSLTERFRRRAAQWRSTAGLADAAVAAMIRGDGIDILVDLAQHLPGNRLSVFARRPAPVQVSFAGYPETTGLDAIEYRISDRHLEGGAALGREKICLLDSFWCYDPGGLDLPVNALPASRHGYVTFGSLNNFCKVNAPVLQLWARVLEQVENSRLLLLCGPGSLRQRTLEVFAARGIAAPRLEFVEWSPRREYLELYHRVDLVLDSFPYQGHTTSLDALWMGVPVVSRVGPQPVSRAGLSQLSNLGLPELVAPSADAFVRIAAGLAGDLSRLAELRATLRERMKNSVLMNAPHFARQIEQAYRQIWRAWCAEEPGPRPPAADGKKTV